MLPGATASVVAYHIGQNFGFKEDDKLDRPCACDDPSGACIMNTKLFTS